MRIIAAAVFVASLVACATAPLGPGGTDPRENRFPPVANATDCATIGGAWRQLGRQALFVCDVPTTDAGRPCLDRRDCESICVAPAQSSAGSPVTGACYRSYLTLGTCLARVTGGVVNPEVCVD